MSAIIDQTRPDQTRPDHSIVRNSSFELLRIVAMLMIVAHHFSVHGGFNFPVGSMTLNHLWQLFILMGGGLGNGIFVAVSGYFLINSTGLNFRRLFNLWTRIFFYSLVIYFLFVYAGLEAFSLKMLLKAFMPITKNQWWFASAYFVMYLIHPYVNKLLHSFTREEYRKFLLAVFFYWSIIPVLTKSSFGANATINFVCIYSLAGYVRLYVPEYYPLEAAGYGNDDEGKRFIRVKGVRWFANMEHHRHNETLCLFRKYYDDPSKYPHYDNYDAIEVSKVVDIPCNWLGVMGVPVTFLDKYNPKQFEILGISENGSPLSKGDGKNDRPYINGKRIYARIFIRRIGDIM